MRADAYLARIRYDGRRSPSVETLRGLHRAHMTSVPFENLDIQLGIPIVLSVPAFFDKIVARRRGGFCYELNGLFAWLLEDLGFRVTLLSARVASPKGLSAEFDHLALLVELEDRWIADVGFGDSSVDPLPLAAAGDGEFTLVESAGTWTMQRWSNGIVEPQYVFEIVPHRLEEFAPRCRYQQVSPESHFTQNAICSLATPAGRISLSGRRLIETSGARREERQLSSSGEYRTVLRTVFGLDLALPESERLTGRLFPS